jgi:hypothetical protein
MADIRLKEILLTSKNRIKVDTTKKKYIKGFWDMIEELEDRAFTRFGVKMVTIYDLYEKMVLYDVDNVPENFDRAVNELKRRGIYVVTSAPLSPDSIVYIAGWGDYMIKFPNKVRRVGFDTVEYPTDIEKGTGTHEAEK